MAENLMEAMRDNPTCEEAVRCLWVGQNWQTKGSLDASLHSSTPASQLYLLWTSGITSDDENYGPSSALDQRLKTL